MGSMVSGNQAGAKHAFRRFMQTFLRPLMKRVFVATILGTLLALAQSNPTANHSQGNAMDQSNSEDDPPLNAEEQARANRLTPSEVKRIDEALLRNTAPQWRKVARVVGTAMIELKLRPESVPDIYYAQRVAEMVKLGQLEAQGNLRRMRYSEVRRPNH
jgi:hypothetical protein